MGIYFSNPGPENTDETLKIAFEAARVKNIDTIVVASTTGWTAEKALPLYKQSDRRLVIVTHNTGFNQVGGQQFHDEIRKKLEQEGVIVFTGTMALRNVGTAIRKKFGGYSEEELINATLRILGQGVKVGIEMAAMVCDAGLVHPQDIITVAGTATGADTALVIAANSSNRFFDIRVREVLAKPR